MASAGPSGKSRDSPMTRMRIRVSSSRGTSEQRRRKKLRDKSTDRYQEEKTLINDMYKSFKRQLTSCHSPGASCPTCSMSLVAL